MGGHLVPTIAAIVLLKMSHFVNYIPGGRFITIAICFIQKFTIISSFGPIFLFRKIFAKVFISLVVLCFFTPRLKSRRGIAMSMSVRPSVPPSLPPYVDISHF